MHHVETYTPSFILDDLKAAASALRARLATLLRRVTVQHVSGQWVEQHQRDSAKHGGAL